eukprot:Hpha_TRINITY_DN23135_c0_g1::TRINITY_DN23135_c0_g1_i1::g.29655::m.29655
MDGNSPMDQPPPLRTGPVPRDTAPGVSAEERQLRIQTLIDVTGVEERVALAALTRFSWNTQVAASQFFENGFADLDASPEPPPPAAVTIPELALGGVTDPVEEEQVQTVIRRLSGVLPGADPGVVRQLLIDCGGDVDSAIRMLMFFEYGDADAAAEQPGVGLRDADIVNALRLQLMQREQDVSQAYLSQSSPTHVYCNVYRLAPDHTLEKINMGIYHSGIEVYGREWSFGGNPSPELQDVSGVFWVPPKTAVENFYKSIDLGETHLSPQEVLTVVDSLKKEWTIGTYHVLNRNCNHFSHVLAPHLKVKKPPSWVNRAARWGKTLVPTRVVNYFLNQAAAAPPEADGELEADEPPPPTPPDPQLGSPAERSRGGRFSNWFKRGKDDASVNPTETPQPHARSPPPGTMVRAVSNAKGCIAATDATHSHDLTLAGCPHGQVVPSRAGVPPGECLVSFPQQRFVEAGTRREVLLGPFVAVMRVADLEPDRGERPGVEQGPPPIP